MFRPGRSNLGFQDSGQPAVKGDGFEGFSYDPPPPVDMSVLNEVEELEKEREASLFGSGV